MNKRYVDGNNVTKEGGKKVKNTNIEQCAAAQPKILTVAFYRFVRFLICAEAEVMTKPDSSDPVDQHYSPCQSNYPFFSIQPVLMGTQLLRAPELPCIRCLFHSCTGRSMQQRAAQPSTRHPNVLLTQAAKSQTNQASGRLDLAIRGCRVQGHQVQHGAVQRVPPVLNWMFGAKSWVVCRAAHGSAALEPAPHRRLALRFELLLDIVNPHFKKQQLSVAPFYLVISCCQLQIMME